MSQLQRGGINYHNVKWRCHKCDINGSEKYPKKCPKCKGPIWTSEKADVMPSEVVASVKRILKMKVTIENKKETKNIETPKESLKENKKSETKKEPFDPNGKDMGKMAMIVIGIIIVMAMIALSNGKSQPTASELCSSEPTFEARQNCINMIHAANQ